MELTVYNQDLGLVKEVRTLNLKKGVTEVRLEDVAAQLDPTSVTLTPINSATTYVSEQNFEYDLASDSKLLFKFLDKPVSVFTNDGGMYEGILLAGVNQEVRTDYNYDSINDRRTPQRRVYYNYGNLVLTKDREKGPINIIRMSDNVREIRLPELPTGLITKPALMWQVQSDKEGPQKCLLTYMTSGMEWRADYGLLLNADDTKGNLNAWVTLDNHSGMSFENARVKLMAGDLAFGDDDTRREYRTRGFVYGSKQADQGPVADMRQVFEYRQYTLDERTTVKNNQTKQVKLLKADNVPVTKFYVYDGVQFDNWSSNVSYGLRQQREYGTQSDKKVMVFLEWVNTAKNGLGMALPAGKVRLFKQDTDDSVQFIGEERIDHIPANEVIRVRVGEAFDLVGERKQTDFKQITDHVVEEAFEIAVRNQKKDQPVEVRVVEHLYRGIQWEIIEKSQDFTKTDAQTAEFRVTVPPGEERKVTYRVRYSW